MRKTPVLSLITIFVALMVQGCAPRDADGLSGLTLKDDGRKVEIRKGQVLAVDLEGNPTTGYTWEAQDLDTGIIQQQGNPAYQSRSDLIGSPGVQKFTFKAVGAGKTTLKMIYHRPWEKGKEPLKVFSVSITVR